MRCSTAKHLKRICILAILLMLLGGCATLHQRGDLPVKNVEADAIIKLIEEKERAVNSKELGTFLEQIDQNNKEYYIEQKRWFEYYQSATASNYKLELVDIAKRDFDTYVTEVVQSYIYGPKRENRKASFHLKFVRTENGWKDSDLEFVEFESERFVIKGMKSIDPKAQMRIGQEAEDAYEKVVSLYGSEIDDKTVIKLYDDTHLIRELTKVSLERIRIVGWYEYQESIKLFVDRANSKDLTALIAHELVHKQTLSQSNNLCAWFAEGLAMYFGNFNVWGQTYIEKGWLPKDKHIRSIKWLEKQDFEKLNEWQEIVLCYGISGMIVMHIEDEYGQGKSTEILNALKKYPQADGVGFDFNKHNEIRVGYLNQAIEEVLQIDIDAFDQRWMAWMANYDKVNPY